MVNEDIKVDGIGRDAREVYDREEHGRFRPFIEKLRNFDPDLRFAFNKLKQRWCILQPIFDRSGYKVIGEWNILIVCEDRDGSPKDVGDWVFNRLYVYKHRAMERDRSGVDNFLNRLMDKSKEQAEAIEKKGDEERIYGIKQDINQWRRASKELYNTGARSDVTCGYRKIEPKKRGIDVK